MESRKVINHQFTETNTICLSSSYEIEVLEQEDLKIPCPNEVKKMAVLVVLSPGGIIHEYFIIEIQSPGIHNAVYFMFTTGKETNLDFTKLN